MAKFQLKTNATNAMTVEAARYRHEGEWIVFRGDGDDDRGVPVMSVRAESIHWIKTLDTTASA